MSTDTEKDTKTAKRKKKTGGETAKKRGNSAWNDIRYGRSVSLEFFKTHAWLMMVFVVAVISLMGLRYKTKTKMLEIKKLTVELQRAESRKLQEKAGYMTIIRETELKKMVEEKGLDLQFQEQPPYELKDD